MTDFINNDTVNNITYMNYFNAVTNGEINPNTGGSSVNVRNACNTRWGAGSAAMITDGAHHYLSAFPNSSNEMKTSRTASSTNYRIKCKIPSTSAFNTMLIANSNNTTGTTDNAVNLASGITGSAIANSYEYATITNDLLIVSGFASSGASLNTATRQFIVSGWLKDSPFSGGNITRSLFSLFIDNTGIRSSARVSAENQTTVQTLLTSGNAQYPITCASNTGDGTTPGADLWCTDLWLRDNPSGYAVGRIPHVLLAKGAGFTLGNLYYNPTVIDGITDQKIWLCCANYGSDKLLQRVWTEGIG
jgi:hypothetical protein